MTTSLRPHPRSVGPRVRPGTDTILRPTSVPRDTIENYNKDQLSNTDARIEAVEKSISELHKRLTKETEI